MKFKVLLLLMATHSFSAKANDFSSSVLRNAKITAIDAALSKAKTFEEIKSASYKMYQLIFENFNDTCPQPKKIDYQALCIDIGTKAKSPTDEAEYYEYSYEGRLLKLACVNIFIDNEETIKSKVQLFWNKYKTQCRCDSITFPVQNGNILKFVLSQNFPDLIDLLADYGCDINFIDPADGLNLLDYVMSEIERLRQLQNSENTVMVYEKFKANIIFLGGKSNKN